MLCDLKVKGSVRDILRTLWNPNNVDYWNIDSLSTGKTKYTGINHALIYGLRDYYCIAVF